MRFSPLLISLFSFAAIMGGIFAGAALQKVLPKQHLSDESKEMAKIGAGFIATLAALVLGLLIASSKSSYDTKSEEVERSSAKIILLDRDLRQYGEQAKPVRHLLREVLVVKHKITWVESEARAASRADAPRLPQQLGIEQIRTQIVALVPTTDEQRSLRTAALSVIDELTQMRWLLIEQSTAAISTPMLVVMIIWLVVVAGCLAIYAPRNGTVLAVAVLCSLSASCAIFLIMEMYEPFGGFISISDAPIRTAINYISQ